MCFALSKTFFNTIFKPLIVCKVLLLNKKFCKESKEEASLVSILITCTKFGELQYIKSLLEEKFIASTIGLLKVKTSPLIILCSLSDKNSSCIPFSPGTIRCNIFFPPSNPTNKESLTLGKNSIDLIAISFSLKLTFILKILDVIPDKYNFLSYLY